MEFAAPLTNFEKQVILIIEILKYIYMLFERRISRVMNSKVRMHRMFYVKMYRYM